MPYGGIIAKVLSKLVHLETKSFECNLNMLFSEHACPFVYNECER